MAENENPDLNENPDVKKEKHEKVKDFQGAIHNKNPRKTVGQTMTDDQYLEQRVVDQMTYFGRKASESQKKYKKLKRWEVIIAASIPVLIIFAALSVFESIVIWDKKMMIDDVQIIKPIFTMSHVLQMLAALGGILIVIIKGLVDLEDYYKTWKDYRSLEMGLQEQRYKFITRTEPYDEEDAYPMLVEEVEGSLNKQNQKWRSVKKQPNEFAKKAEEMLLKEFDKKDKVDDAELNKKLKGIEGDEK